MSAEPGRAKFRRETMLPRGTKSRAESEALSRDIPRPESEAPSRKKLRRETMFPKLI